MRKSELILVVIILLSFAVGIYYYPQMPDKIASHWNAQGQAFAILFYFTGILIENTKRNWFIGIRTPWTLSSDRVWDKTHKIAGKLFKIAGIAALGAMFFETAAIFFIIVPVIIISIYAIVYSYFEYQKDTIIVKYKLRVSESIQEIGTQMDFADHVILFSSAIGNKKVNVLPSPYLLST